MCHIKKFLYVHCPWRKGCENFDGKNIRIRSSKVFFLVFLSSLDTKELIHTKLKYQMFDTLTMIGNDECRFSSC